jgi:Cu/Ag efflux pump CusA
MLSSTIPGAVDIQSEISPSVPELLIRLKPEKLTYWNFTPGEVLETVSACFRGSVAGEIYNQTRVIDVLVILKESDRKNINTIKSLPIRNSNGVSVPLEELADIRYESGRFCITHEAQKDWFK